MLFNAADFGNDGRAIQAAINAAVVSPAKGARGATIYVPRIGGQKSWVLREPLEWPTGSFRLIGDGAAGWESDWGGTLLEMVTPGQPAILIRQGRGLHFEGFSIRGGGIRLAPNVAAGQTISRCSFVDLSIGAPGGTAFNIQGETDNEQCDTLTLDRCQLEGAIGFRSWSRQAVGVRINGGAIVGHMVGVLHERGFVHLNGVTFGTKPSTGACILQFGGQSHLTCVDGYAEVASGEFYRCEGEHWRPTAFHRTRVFMQRGNPEFAFNAPQAYALSVDRDSVIEEDSQSVNKGERVYAPYAHIEARRLGPGSRPISWEAT